MSEVSEELAPGFIFGASYLGYLQRTLLSLAQQQHKRRRSSLSLSPLDEQPCWLLFAFVLLLFVCLLFFGFFISWLKKAVEDMATVVLRFWLRRLRAVDREVME